ncbi:MAG TPA: 3-oxoacyl-ACP synthase [Clostridiales bacterium]|nr:3-oxoacyl-ACP synthase [Clostridiales bacterium]
MPYRDTFVTLAGLGSALPGRVLTNGDLERMVETSDEWIVERTGIRQRRLAAPHEATSDLALAASRKALSDAGMDPADLDLIIVGTVTPDMPFPSTACLLQDALGARRAAAMDLGAACTGFIYGLAAAEGFLASGRFRTVLVVGAETLSRITDYQDRSTCVLFGDGAGAAVVRRATSAGGGLLSVYLAADGRGAGILRLPAGGSRRPADMETVASRQHFIHMDGREVFRFAVRAMVSAVKESLHRAGLRVSDVDLFIPHQANTRIIDTAVRLLGIPPEKVFHTIETYGNISSASIPVSLDEARRGGRLRPGDTVLLVAFGAGLTYGGAVLRWEAAAARAPAGIPHPCARVPATVRAQRTQTLMEGCDARHENSTR